MYHSKVKSQHMFTYSLLLNSPLIIGHLLGMTLIRLVVDWCFRSVTGCVLYQLLFLKTLFCKLGCVFFASRKYRCASCTPSSLLFQSTLHETWLGRVCWLRAGMKSHVEQSYLLICLHYIRTQFKVSWSVSGTKYKPYLYLLHV